MDMLTVLSALYRHEHVGDMGGEIYRQSNTEGRHYENVPVNHEPSQL